MTVPDPVGRWGRLRWMVRAALAVGVAASVAANVLHAHPNPIAQAIAGWPPLALLLTVELVGRVPVHRRLLSVLRLIATSVIAGIAAFVSYGHMAAVAARYGETTTAARLLPISVDGLIVVASICLVEIGARLNAGQEQAPTVDPLRRGLAGGEGRGRVRDGATTPSAVGQSDVDTPPRPSRTSREGMFGMVRR